MEVDLQELARRDLWLLMPTPTHEAVINVGILELTGSQLGLACWQLASWKSFLKIVLAYCVGYDKRKKTNLTRRK